MKRIIVGFVVLSLTAVTLLAQDSSEVPKISGNDQLVKEKGPYQETWIRPDADIGRYDKLYVWHPVFDFREGGTEATGTAITRSRRDQGPYVFDEEDQERFKKMVGEIVVKNLANSKRFDVVTTLGPGTLFVRCAMLDIVSDVPPDLGRNSTKVHLASVGEATVVFELIDAETGVIQARVAERRTIQAPGRMHQVSAMPSTTNSVWNDVKLWATDVAQTLRRELDKAKKKADK
jgi:hypothetical protein